MTVQVSLHAIARWQERVAACSVEEARAAILASARVIERAVEFGASTIRLGNGARLIVDNGLVITVLAKGQRNLTLAVPATERKHGYV